MAIFRYEAIDRSGKLVRGAMDARDEGQVGAKLSAMGYSVRAIYDRSGSSATASKIRQANPRQSTGIGSAAAWSGIPVNVRSCVPHIVLARFFRHMATLVKAGIPLAQALAEMAPTIRERHLKKVMPHMLECSQTGKKLSGVMADYPGVFPVHAIASVWSGELCGRVDSALEEVADDLEHEASEIRYGRFGWGLAKLNFIGLAFVLPLCNFRALLSPIMSAAENSGGNMGTSQILKTLWQTYVHDMLPKSLVLLTATIIIWILWGHLKRLPALKRVLDEMLIHVPVWGALNRDRALAAFLRTFGRLYAAGIMPSTAWDAASLTPQNSVIAERLRSARSSLQPDAGVVQLFSAAKIFEPEDVDLASAGERTGQIPDVLTRIEASCLGRVAAARMRGRAISSFALITSSLLLSAYCYYQVQDSYMGLILDFADPFKGQ